MISVTPSPPQPSRTAWTSKPCPPCRGTTMPGSPCAPTPTPRSRSRTRPPRLWAASWDRLYNRVSSSKNRTGRQIFPSGAFLSFPTVSACGSRCGSGFLTRTVKQLFATKKSPKTEVFGDFWSCYPDLNRRPHPYQLIGRVRFFAFGRFCVFFRSTDRTIWHSCVRCLRPLVSPCGSACGSAKMVPLKISTTISKAQYFTHRRFLSVFNCSRRGAGTLGSNF